MQGMRFGLDYGRLKCSDGNNLKYKFLSSAPPSPCSWGSVIIKKYERPTTRKRTLGAADQLRANSKLTAAEYAMPVLGLIFLRHADNRFKAYLPDILASILAAMPAAQREELIKTEFLGKSAIYLQEAARFDAIASFPRRIQTVVATPG